MATLICNNFQLKTSISLLQSLAENFSTRSLAFTETTRNETSVHTCTCVRFRCISVHGSWGAGAV